MEHRLPGQLRLVQPRQRGPPGGVEEKRAGGLYRDGPADDGSDGLPEVAGELRIDRPRDRQALPEADAVTEEEGEEGEEAHQPQPAYLYQHEYHDLPEVGVDRSRVHHREPRHAHGGGGREEGIQRPDAVDGGGGQEQQACSGRYDGREGYGEYLPYRHVVGEERPEALHEYPGGDQHDPDLYDGPQGPEHRFPPASGQGRPGRGCDGQAEEQGDPVVVPDPLRQAPPVREQHGGQVQEPQGREGVRAPRLR